MQRSRRSFAAITAALAATFFIASGAVADSWAIYLEWGSTVGSCTGNTYQSYGDQTFDPKLHSAVQPLGGVVVAGAVKTQKWNQDGVRVATRYFGCTGGSVKTYYAPRVYNHRWRTDSWYCTGGSCAPLPTAYGSWLSGLG